MKCPPLCSQEPQPDQHMVEPSRMCGPVVGHVSLWRVGKDPGTPPFQHFWGPVSTEWTGLACPPAPWAVRCECSKPLAGRWIPQAFPSTPTRNLPAGSRVQLVLSSPSCLHQRPPSCSISISFFHSPSPPPRQPPVLPSMGRHQDSRAVPCAGYPDFC